MFKNTLIVGLGLIGGSLAFDIKSLKLSENIHAFDKSKLAIKKGIELGIIDDGFNLHTNYDFVIFANPISTLEESAFYLKDYTKDAIITDSASVKTYVEDIFKPIFKENFVGSHPIAGSHKSGIENAQNELFKNKLSIVCPTGISRHEYISVVESFWEAIGSKVLFLDSKTHDKIFSITSHLPHLVAYTLVSSLPQEYIPYVGQGFLDTTRIGASESNIWSDIFLYNKDNLLKAIKLFKENIGYLENILKSEDKTLLKSTLQNISNKRKNLQKSLQSLAEE